MTNNFDRDWAFCSETGEDFIPYLHDCIATEIRQDGSELSLFFPDGFWILANDPRNPFGDTLHRTGSSMVVVSMVHGCCGATTAARTAAGAAAGTRTRAKGECCRKCHCKHEDLFDVVVHGLSPWSFGQPSMDCPSDEVGQ